MEETALREPNSPEMLMVPKKHNYGNEWVKWGGLGWGVNAEPLGLVQRRGVQAPWSRAGEEGPVPSRTCGSQACSSSVGRKTSRPVRPGLGFHRWAQVGPALIHTVGKTFPG